MKKRAMKQMLKAELSEAVDLSVALTRWLEGMEVPPYRAIMSMAMVMAGLVRSTHDPDLVFTATLSTLAHIYNNMEEETP